MVQPPSPVQPTPLTGEDWEKKEYPSEQRLYTVLSTTLQGDGDIRRILLSNGQYMVRVGTSTRPYYFELCLHGDTETFYERDGPRGSSMYLGGARGQRAFHRLLARFDPLTWSCRWNVLEGETEETLTQAPIPPLLFLFLNVRLYTKTTRILATDGTYRVMVDYRSQEEIYTVCPMHPSAGGRGTLPVFPNDQEECVSSEESFRLHAYKRLLDLWTPRWCIIWVEGEAAHQKMTALALAASHPSLRFTYIPSVLVLPERHKERKRPLRT